ncbi:hypothetical protein AgCh_020951 [Apium graveolens]
MAGGNSTGEKLARLEDFLGVPLSIDEIPIANQVQVLRKGLNELKTMVYDLVRVMNEGYDAQIPALCDELVLVKRAAIAGSSSGREGHSNLKILEPKPYDGVRVTKDLENFLWEIEQYFRVAHIDVTEQVSITSMYLVDDAKLWWRTRTDGDVSVDRPEITTYKNMLDDDKLFNFLTRLKPWAREELRQQAVTDLPTAIIVADSLVDYKLAGSNDTERGKNSGKNHKGEDRNKKMTGKMAMVMPRIIGNL